jgi:hypothetical protein
MDHSHMPTILKRNRSNAPAQGPETRSANIAALMANVELGVASFRSETISHREFREFVRARARSENDVWAPIRHERFSRGL